MNEQHDIGDARLRMALHALRRDIEPGHDLWPGIQARLSPRPAAARPPRRVWPLAMAASMLLALGLARQGAPELARPVVVETPASAAATPVASEAEALTLHYQAALREFDASATPASWQPGLEALDHGAQQVLAALQQNPHSPQLLEQLRQLYARRLVLSRRALFV